MARIIGYQDALEAVEAPWTVSGVLGGLGLMWGEAGVGKSFVACSLAAAVATKRPWLGHPVQGGSVVYIAGEGGAQGTARRLDAAITALHCCDPDDGPVPLWIVTPGVNLVEGPAELIRLMGDMQPELIVVDTLARCFGGDENSTEDMSKFVRTLDLLRDLNGGSVLVVHHANKTNKSGSGKVRGSSVLYGAVDVSMQLVKGEKDTARLVADKLRDRPTDGNLAELSFESVPVYGEADEMGDERTTRVVKPGPTFKRALAEIAMVPLRNAVTYQCWRDQMPTMEKALFDRLVTQVVGDPSTWGIHEGPAGVYGTRRAA